MAATTVTVTATIVGGDAVFDGAVGDGERGGLGDGVGGGLWFGE